MKNIRILQSLKSMGIHLVLFCFCFFVFYLTFHYDIELSILEKPHNSEIGHQNLQPKPAQNNIKNIGIQNLSENFLDNKTIEEIQIQMVQKRVPPPTIKSEVVKIKTLAHFKYSKRRNIIREYCQKYLNKSSDLLEVNLDPKWKGELWFDYKYNFLYCDINKVSSTTWVKTLLRYVL